MSLTLKCDQQILEHPHKHRTLSPVRIATDNSTIRVRSRSHNQEQDGNTGGMYDRFNKLRLIANKDLLIHFRSMYFPWFSTFIYRINSRIWVPSFRSDSWRSSSYLAAAAAECYTCQKVITDLENQMCD
jgi:hypothetical protein